MAWSRGVPRRSPRSSFHRSKALGGLAPLDGPRHIYWNFVSSTRERIEAASRDWREHRFAPVPGDAERIPLPDE